MAKFEVVLFGTAPVSMKLNIEAETEADASRLALEAIKPYTSSTAGWDDDDGVNDVEVSEVEEVSKFTDKDLPQLERERDLRETEGLPIV